VGFLSLPGLDDIARVAEFISILFSVFSIASTIVVIFKYMGRPVAHIGRDSGLVVLSGRNVIMLLPLVLLSSVSSLG